MVEKIQQAIERHRMAKPGERWGVAVSGGPDSVALLAALVELASEMRLTLSVVHVNHKLRGGEADEDEAFVRQTAEKYALDVHAHAAPVKDAPGENLEAAARAARYAFFEQLLAGGAVDRIATGHTLTDQAETVLFRVLRGTGIAGLAGVRPARAPGIVRPMIEVERSEVLQWLRERGLEWREDSSNADQRFARNRLRSQLIPDLKTEWNPQIEQALARLGAQAAEEESYWDQLVGAALAKLTSRREAGAVVIDCPHARELHPALLSRCLERLAREVKAEGRQIDARTVGALAAMMLANGPRELRLPGLEARRSCDFLRLAAPAEDPAPATPVEISPPAEADAPDGRTQVHLRPISPDNQIGGYNNENRRLLDGDKVLYPLYLRAWRPGDRVLGAGDEGERLLREMFRRSAIPAWERECWPVLTFAGQGADEGKEAVVWSRGFGVSPAFAAGSSTCRALEVREIAGDGREIRRIEDWAAATINEEV